VKKSEKVLESGPLERLFTGNATAKILDFLIAMQEFDYSETDIAKHADVALRTVNSQLPKLLQSGLVIQTRNVGKAKMYRLAKEGVGKELEQLVLTLAMKEVEEQAQEVKLTA
jgi:predicted transcriptional regulator